MGKKYLDWGNAGGPNECEHGYAKGIPCPRCDDEHNRVLELEARVQEARFIADKKHAFIEKQSEAYTEQRERAERAEAALRTLVGAVDGMYSPPTKWDAWSTLKEALEQARAALPQSSGEGEEAKSE